MGERARLVATGNTFAIGSSDDSYAIWNMTQQGRPVVTKWPLNEAGWQAAAARFLQLEGIDVSKHEPATEISSVRPITNPRDIPVASQATVNSNSMATLGGALGIIGALVSLTPVIGIGFGLLLGVLAIVFSGIGLNRTDHTGAGKGLAILGLVLGILTVFFKLIPGLNLL